ncbi:hypothetical protein K4H28_09530 [Deefgea tanakiae]|uniref:Uncharacterized protein n=1 Tax=Deefgea tanakiae TaxID=2865840 RepID=A0ABX8Z1X1_9NEIS|nr:hypothetical protein [Deefgea tanakiae]QZA76573.1 hypothetical protein K4H28_09530 [Deefgea tanakiae]
MMNLETAKTIVANWDKPLIRQLFWYLVIPAYVEIQRAEPSHFVYHNQHGWSYRWLTLLQSMLALLMLLVVDTALSGTLAVLGQLLCAYFMVMYGVWTLAYWSMKIPRPL